MRVPMTGFLQAILLDVWSGRRWLMLLRFLLRRAALGGRCGANRGCAKVTPFGQLGCYFVAAQKKNYCIEM